jgi:cation diffusion facilitator family transporter
MVETQTANSYRDQVRRTLWHVLVLNLIVAAAKIAVGLLTRSLAMIADGFHSTLDASSNVIGLFGNALAARPPDDSHPYGHERFETIATLAIGGLLLAAAVEIIRSVLQRLSTGGQPEVTAMSFAAMLVTLAVNVGTLFYERRVGRCGLTS